MPRATRWQQRRGGEKWLPLPSRGIASGNAEWRKERCDKLLTCCWKIPYLHPQDDLCAMQRSKKHMPAHGVRREQGRGRQGGRGEEERRSKGYILGTRQCNVGKKEAFSLPATSRLRLWVGSEGGGGEVEGDIASIFLRKGTKRKHRKWNSARRVRGT